MSYLTIDIETAKLDNIPVEDQNDIDSSEDKDQAESLLPLNPFASQIVCIGIKKSTLDEHDKGWVLINSDKKIQSENENYKYVCCDETTLLSKFWEFLTKIKFKKFITFNGRGFDFPYLALRSTYLGIPLTMDLMRGSDWSIDDYHIDLALKLTFGKFSGNGPLKRRKLDYYCKRYLGASPKTDEISGSKVGQVFREGKIDEIAKYCIEDVEKTFQLYKKIKSLNLIYV